MRAHTRLVSFILMHKWPCELKLLLQPIWVSSLVYHIFEAITISFLCVMLTNSHISPGVYDYTGDLFGESEATRRYQDTVGVTEISYRRGEYFTYLGLLLLWKEAYNQSASLCEQGKHLGGGVIRRWSIQQVFKMLYPPVELLIWARQFFPKLFSWILCHGPYSSYLVSQLPAYLPSALSGTQRSTTSSSIPLHPIARSICGQLV